MLNSYDLVVSALRFIRFDVSKAHRYAMLVDAFDGVPMWITTLSSAFCRWPTMPVTSATISATFAALASSSTGWLAK